MIASAAGRNGGMSDERRRQGGREKKITRDATTIGRAQAGDLGSEMRRELVKASTAAKMMVRKVMERSA